MLPVAGYLEPKYPDTSIALDRAQFGAALACGDFDGDGKPDAAIGIPSKTASHVTAAGTVVLLAGNNVGLDLATHAYLIQERIGGVSEVADQYGYSLATGNWNADRFDDLAVGAPFEDIEVGSAGSIADAGAVFVHYGDGSMASSNGQILREGGSLTPGVPESNDWFGLTLASKRLGNVDVEFLAIGIPGKQMPNLNTADCNKSGAVQLAMAWPGTGPVPDPTFLLHQDTAARTTSPISASALPSTRRGTSTPAILPLAPRAASSLAGPSRTDVSAHTSDAVVGWPGAGVECRADDCVCAGSL